MMMEQLKEARQEANAQAQGQEVTQPQRRSRSEAKTAQATPGNNGSTEEALEAIRRELAALRARLEAPRQRIAVETAQHPAAPRSDIAEQAAENAAAADGALGLSPLVGFKGADIRASLRQLAGKAWTSP